MLIYYIQQNELYKVCINKTEYVNEGGFATNIILNFENIKVIFLTLLF